MTLRYVGLTGTPGTGKKSVAPLLAEALGVPCVSLNDLALGRRRTRSKGPVEVEPLALRRKLLAAAPESSLVYGHLLPHVLRRGEVSRVVVLRCEPSVLRSRLEARGYDPAHVRENVEAELIGVLVFESAAAFGWARLFEFDTTKKSPRRSADEIAGIIRGARRQPRIDWSLRYGSARKLVSLLGADRTDPALT